jgi:hypothetical protein
MRVRNIFNCQGGLCPTVYEDSDGSIVIQGYKLSDEDRKKITTPDGEDAIRIPRAFFDQLLTE